MEGFRVRVEPMGVGFAALLFLSCLEAQASSVGTESTFGKDVMAQALAYDGHQSLANRKFEDGIVTWSLATSMTKAGSGDSSSSTVGFGGGLGWRNPAWDVGGALSYSTNSTAHTTSIAPSVSVARRWEFPVRVQRRRPQQKSPVKNPAASEPLDLEPVEETVQTSGFKPSFTMRGGARYEKTKQTSSSGGGSSLPIPLPAGSTESSVELGTLGLSAMMLFNPNPWFAIGGGITRYSHSQSSTSSSGVLSGLDLGSATSGDLEALGSVASLGSLGSYIPGGTGISSGALQLFGGAPTFGALAATAFDAILMVFPARWVDIEMRGNLTTLTEGTETIKDIRGMFYFHLSDAWTLGTGAEHAFSSVSRQTFVTASLNYAFY